jgi:type II secretory pathway pseudopilin PulG
MRRLQAFTIIELLVVLGVIVLLLAIAVPVLSAVRTSQRKERVAAAVTTLSTAVDSYQNDYGVHPLADPPSDLVADGVNKGNRALVYFLRQGEAAGARSAPYLPSAYYDDRREIEGDILLDEWEYPFIYFDTSAMSDDTEHTYALRGNATVSPVRSSTTDSFYNFGRFQLWSVGPNGRNDGGPNPDDEHNDDIGNFELDD